MVLTRTHRQKCMSRMSGSQGGHYGTIWRTSIQNYLLNHILSMIDCGWLVIKIDPVGYYFIANFQVDKSLLHQHGSHLRNTTPLVMSEPRDRHYGVCVRVCAVLKSEIVTLCLDPHAFPVNTMAQHHSTHQWKEPRVLPLPAAIHNHLAHSCFLLFFFKSSSTNQTIFLIVFPVWIDINSSHRTQYVSNIDIKGRWTSAYIQSDALIGLA